MYKCINHNLSPLCIQYFDAVGWETGRASGLQKHSASKPLGMAVKVSGQGTAKIRI